MPAPFPLKTMPPSPAKPMHLNASLSKAIPLSSLIIACDFVIACNAGSKSPWDSKLFTPISCRDLAP